jgi:hypothetical protein
MADSRLLTHLRDTDTAYVITRKADGDGLDGLWFKRAAP